MASGRKALHCITPSSASQMHTPHISDTSLSFPVTEQLSIGENIVTRLLGTLSPDVRAGAGTRAPPSPLWHACPHPQQTHQAKAEQGPSPRQDTETMQRQERAEAEQPGTQKHRELQTSPTAVSLCCSPRRTQLPGTEINALKLQCFLYAAECL